MKIISYTKRQVQTPINICRQSKKQAGTDRVIDRWTDWTDSQSTDRQTGLEKETDKEGNKKRHTQK